MMEIELSDSLVTSVYLPSGDTRTPSGSAPTFTFARILPVFVSSTVADAESSLAT